MSVKIGWYLLSTPSLACIAHFHKYIFFNESTFLFLLRQSLLFWILFESHSILVMQPGLLFTKINSVSSVCSVHPPTRKPNNVSNIYRFRYIIFFNSNSDLLLSTLHWWWVVYFRRMQLCFWQDNKYTFERGADQSEEKRGNGETNAWNVISNKCSKQKTKRRNRDT